MGVFWCFSYNLVDKPLQIKICKLYVDLDGGSMSLVSNSLDLPIKDPVHWLYIDFNSFFASCEQQSDPRLRNKPVAVVPMKSDSTCVIAASYPAKAFGIKTGTSVRDAKRLCPGLILVEAGHSDYVRYHHKALEVIDTCIPVHSVCSIDEICCELTGTQKNLDKAMALTQKIKQAFREHLGECLTVSIGLGPNILLSKMAADMKKPDAVTSLLEKELPHKLHSLQLRDVPGIGARMEQRLLAQGVRSMEQLLNLNEMQMRGIWGGVVGSRYYYLLRGKHIPHVATETKSIGHEHVLPPKERNYEDALIVLQKLLSKASLRLRRGGWMARQLYIYVRYMDQDRRDTFVRFHETQDTSFLIKRLKEMYFHFPRRQAPIKVSVTLSDFVSETQHQLSFFSNDKKNQIFKVVDRINEKWGRDTVHLACLHEHLSSAPTRIAFSRIPEIDEVD